MFPETGVCVIVANPVTPLTATPPALIVEIVQLAPCTAAMTSFGLKARGPGTMYACAVVDDCMNGTGVERELDAPYSTVIRSGSLSVAPAWIATGTGRSRGHPSRLAAEAAMPLPAMEISRPSTNSP